MSQHNLRRSLAAFALATLATLAPLAGLHAAPGRQGRSESGDETPVRAAGEPLMWKSLLRFLEKAGMRIDGNGPAFAAPIPAGGETQGEKAGLRIDGNG